MAQRKTDIMSGFKSYKIRDGVHIPSEKYKENWEGIFGKKKKPKRKANNAQLKSKTDEALIAETLSSD